MLTIVTAPCFFYGIESWPVFFYDEGYFGQIAKNTARYGVYASRFFDGYTPAQLSVGPVVLLPVAAVYELFGIGIWQSRVLIALSGVCCLLLAYKLAQALSGQFAACVAWFAITTQILFFSRGLFGEVPAICFCFAGLWCWYRAMQRTSLVSAVCAGLAFGMMLVAKPQMAILLPAFGLATVANWLHYHCFSARTMFVMWLVLPVPFILSIIFQAVNLGWTAYGNYILLDLLSSSGASVFPNQKGMIFGSQDAAGAWVALAVGIPCLIWQCYKARERTPRGLLLGTIATGTAISLCWYLFLSPGWPRYGVASYTLIAFLGALTSADAVNWIYRRRSLRFQQSLAQIFGLTSAGTLSLLQIIYMPQSSVGAIDISKSIDSTVQQGELIETYEWPVDFLTNQFYHHPSLIDHNPRVIKFIFEEATEVPTYEFWKFEPRYLVNGPMGKLMRAYPQAVLARCGTLVASSGDYQLYRLRDKACFTEPQLQYRQ